MVGWLVFGLHLYIDWELEHGSGGDGEMVWDGGSFKCFFFKLHKIV